MSGVEVTQVAQQAAIHGEGLRIGAYFCADDEGGHPYGKPENCPFCQAEQNFTEMFYNGPGSPPSYAFCCGSCGAQGPTSSGFARGDHYGARIEAVKDWNKASIAIETLTRENAELKAADRDHLSAKRGMEQRLTAELEATCAELAQVRAEVERLQKLVSSSEAHRYRVCDSLRAQLTATQARLDEEKSQAWERAQRVKAPEDDEILLLCERIGFGAVMDSASRQWILRDPIGAFYIGGCLAKHEGHAS